MKWLHLTSGRGPGECQLCINKIVQIIIDEAAAHGLTCMLLDFEAAYHGYHSALLSVDGEKEAAFVESWNGTIEWIWKSTIRPGHKRKRWFIGISQLEVGSETDIEFSDNQLKWESLRASGPGGQHVNKTESAIRLTHMPSGITVVAREERSQYRNKSLAKARLYGILKERKRLGEVQKEQELWSEHNNLERGNAIRTYEGLDFKLKQ